MENWYLEAEEMALFDEDENGEDISFEATLMEDDDLDGTAMNLAPVAMADLIPMVAIFFVQVEKIEREKTLINWWAVRGFELPGSRVFGDRHWKRLKKVLRRFGNLLYIRTITIGIIDLFFNEVLINIVYLNQKNRILGILFYWIINLMKEK